MRLLILNTAIAATLLFGSAGAGAFGVAVTANYTEGEILSVGDTVTINLFVDPEPALAYFVIPVLAEDTLFDYVPNPACATLYPMPGCGSPTYILYSPAAGMTPLTRMLPTDPFSSTIGVPPGTEKVVVDYANLVFQRHPIVATGTNIWVASIVWHLASVGDGQSELTVDLPSAAVYVDELQLLDPQTIPINGEPGQPWTLTVTTPEPATALLIAMGLLGLAARSRSRRARRQAL